MTKEGKTLSSEDGGMVAGLGKVGSNNTARAPVATHSHIPSVHHSAEVVAEADKEGLAGLTSPRERTQTSQPAGLGAAGLSKIALAMASPAWPLREA